MSKGFIALVSRLTYVAIGVLLGVFGYHEFSLDTQQKFADQLRQHQLAVQQTNRAVVSFSTQSVQPQQVTSKDTNNDLVEEQARLEWQLEQLTNAQSGLILSRDLLQDERSSLSDTSPEAEKIEAKIVTIDDQLSSLTVSIDQIKRDLSDIQEALHSYYDTLSDSINDTFTDLDIE